MTEPSTKNFSPHELRCKCVMCQANSVPNKCRLSSLAKLQRVRDRFYKEFGRGLSLSSAYRSLDHPEEQKKVKRYGESYKGGRHVQGTAFDIRIGWGHERQVLVKIAMEEGFLGFGYANSFLHIDDGRETLTSWTY